MRPISPLKATIVLALLFFGILFFDYNSRTVQRSKDAQKALFALFSNSQPPEEILAQSVAISVNKKVAKFTTENGGLQKLRDVLRVSIVSGSSNKSMLYGSDREKVGLISITVQGGEVSFDLYQSNPMPTLYAIEMHLESHGSSILYFIDDGRFGALFPDQENKR